ncbi:hypothetical protein DFJ74DRAFT_673977 [Hyaloraphidium curvatum]|nr:hypothetical protein DFJ74DRAFT_673977 [Hyaloraphidium curvatum]
MNAVSLHSPNCAQACIFCLGSHRNISLATFSLVEGRWPATLLGADPTGEASAVQALGLCPVPAGFTRRQPHPASASAAIKRRHPPFPSTPERQRHPPRKHQSNRLNRQTTMGTSHCGRFTLFVLNSLVLVASVVALGMGIYSLLRYPAPPPLQLATFASLVAAGGSGLLTSGEFDLVRGRRTSSSPLPPIKQWALPAPASAAAPRSPSTASSRASPCSSRRSPRAWLPTITLSIRAPPRTSCCKSGTTWVPFGTLSRAPSAARASKAACRSSRPSPARRRWGAWPRAGRPSDCWCWPWSSRSRCRRRRRSATRWRRRATSS